MSSSGRHTSGAMRVHLDRAGERVRSRRYERLAWVASGIAAFELARLLVWATIFVFTGGDWRPGPVNSVSTVLLALLGVAVALTCRRGRLGVGWYETIAISFEVVAAALLGAALFGWQQLLSAAAIQQWHLNGREDPWGLGAGEVPWVGVLIMVYCVAVPLRPTSQLVGGLLSTLALAAWIFASLLFGTVPEPLTPYIEELTLAVLLVTGVPTLLCLGIGYVAARRLEQFATQLDEARELGAYRLIERLGQGGMGEVWAARHRMLARPAAIKLVRSRDDGTDSARYATLLERFEREVQATAQLRSPHTVNVYDYGFTDQGTFYYAMELLDGVDLEDLVVRVGPVSAARAIAILEQAADSLAEAHARGLVHRDIKPANIMLCRMGLQEDFVKVLDFGLVKAEAGGLEDVPPLTAEFTFAGTPAYAAPEVARLGASKATPASDIYALGAVAYWLLSGQQLFPDLAPMQVLSKHIDTPPPPLSQHVSTPLPGGLEALVMRCLRKEAGRRPDAAELSAEFGALRVAHPWTQRQAVAWWESEGVALRARDRGEAFTV